MVFNFSVLFLPLILEYITNAEDSTERAGRIVLIKKTSESGFSRRSLVEESLVLHHDGQQSMSAPFSTNRRHVSGLDISQQFNIPIVPISVFTTSCYIPGLKYDRSDSHRFVFLCSNIVSPNLSITRVVL